jgi:hypothetical protein
MFRLLNRKFLVAPRVVARSLCKPAVVAGGLAAGACASCDGKEEAPGRWPAVKEIHRQLTPTQDDEGLRRIFKDGHKVALSVAENSTDGDQSSRQYDPQRYAAYGRGVVQSFLTKGRAIAYTSDIGESARPVMPSWFVNACYGLTFFYVAVSVAHETYEAYEAGLSSEMVGRAAVHATTFEVIASVLMPSLIIHQASAHRRFEPRLHPSPTWCHAAPPPATCHQAVHFAQHHAHRLPPGVLARWAPTAVGLCCIPFLPYLDHPAEVAIDQATSLPLLVAAGCRRLTNRRLPQ